MKVRTGFVSNSSSSSFVVAFEMKPRDEYDLQLMLFGHQADNQDYNNHFFPVPYDEEKDREKNMEGTWPFSTITKIVWDGLVYQKPLSKSKLIAEINSGWFPGHPELANNPYDWKTENDKYEKFYTRESKKEYLAAQKLAEEFLASLPEGSEIYCFEYSDNDGDMFCAMEHSGLFKRFKHLRISKH